MLDLLISAILREGIGYETVARLVQNTPFLTIPPKALTRVRCARGVIIGNSRGHDFQTGLFHGIQHRKATDMLDIEKGIR